MHGSELDAEMSKPGNGCSLNIADNKDEGDFESDYETLVSSVQLGNSVTWTLKKNDEARQRVLAGSVLRRICGISLRERWKMKI